MLRGFSTPGGRHWGVIYAITELNLDYIAKLVLSTSGISSSECRLESFVDGLIYVSISATLTLKPSCEHFGNSGQINLDHGPAHHRLISNGCGRRFVWPYHNQGGCGAGIRVD